MRLTRREFQRLALAAAAGGALSFADPCALAQSPAPDVSFQPFAAQIERLLQALASLGTPLPDAANRTLRRALDSSPANQSIAVQEIINALAPQVLLEVDLNPEMRVSVRRGGARAELVQAGWRTFLIRVNNHAGATTPLRIKSPQGGAVGRRSSLAITGVHDFTNGAVDLVEARQRWIAVEDSAPPPLIATLSGLDLEYRVVQLYSRDAGEREATLQADAGFGEQDLGYRSSVAILFHILPAQALRLHLLDETGAPSIASLLITDALHRVYPPQTKRSMPDLNFQPQVYRYSGEHIVLPPGAYTVEFSRGPEYIAQRVALELSATENAPLSLRLQRWIDAAHHGYYSGDTHIHAAGCSHYESPTEGVTPLVMQRQADGEALALGSVLNWAPGFEYQKQFFTGQPFAPESIDAQHHAAQPAATIPDASSAGGANPEHPGMAAVSGMDQGSTSAGMPHDAGAIAAEQNGSILSSLQHDAAATAHSLLRYDVEVSGFPSSHCGHLVLLQLKEQLYPRTRSIDDWPSWNIPILRWAKQQDAIVGYAHSAHGLVVDSTALPNLLIPPFNSMGANEFIADVTHENVIDFISGCDLWPFAELNIWYHTMNCGYPTSFAGETDFPCLTDACVGGGRSYVPLASPLRGEAGYSRWLTALLQAGSYFGDGRSHIFHFAIQQQQRQREPLQLAQPGTVEISAEICARLEPSPSAATRSIQHASPYAKPYWHLERARLGDSRRVPVELIVNGQAVGRTEIEADGQVRPIRFRTELKRSSWLALRIYPSCHTNPIFVEVQGRPVRASKASAQWCRQGVDVCWEQKRQRIRPAELDAAAAAYDHARAAYDRILRECQA